MRPRVKIFIRSFALVWQSSPRYTFLALVTTIASSVMLPAQMWISKLILDTLFAELQFAGVRAVIDWVGVFAPVFAFLGIWLLGSLSQSSSENFKELLTIRVEHHINDLLLRKAAGLSISFYEHPAFFDQLNNARREIWRVNAVTAQILNVFRFSITLGVTLLLLSQVAVWVPLILLATISPQFAVQAYYLNRRYNLYLSRSTAERKLNYFSWLLTARETVKEIRLFQLQNYFLDLYRRSIAEYFSIFQKLVLSEERLNALLSLLAALGTLSVWGFAIMETALRRITIGDLAITFQAAEHCRSTLSDLFRWSGVALEHSLYIRNLYEFLDLPPDAVSGALTPKTPTGQVSEIPSPAQAEIEFEKVSFHYPGSESLVLQNVSFVLRPGEKVALVGENGAGKTTIVKLLARLYDPTSGRILFGGKDLREFEPEEYYRLFGIIFQDFVRYSLSVQENIGVGRLEDLGRSDLVRQAAVQGGALPLIEKLPKGFATILGKDFEEGVDLSGGEWQKIALSRAFMSASSILILDEPTSSLDALAEYDLYNRFAELTSGKTTIFISHRLSSCKMADHILFFKEGRLIEAGNHAELLAQQGEYSTLFNIQADRYRQ